MSKKHKQLLLAPQVEPIQIAGETCYSKQALSSIKDLISVQGSSSIKIYLWKLS